MLDIDQLLSPDELDWLDDFLLNRINEDLYQEGMEEGIVDLSMLDGFFTAIVSGPEVILPSTWLPVLWGDFEPEWQSAGDAEQVIGLLMRFMNGVSALLMDDPENYEPLFTEQRVDGQTTLSADNWCAGYMRGVSLAAPAWRQVSNDMEILLIPIRFFVEDKFADQRNSASEDEIGNMQKAVIENTPLIHAYWLQQRAGGIPPGSNTEGEIKLPEYSAEQLQRLTPEQLIERMVVDEDRVPRNVIDECAGRGEPMLDALQHWASTAQSNDEGDGEWWLRLHAILILGLMSSERAGEVMMQFIKYLDQQDDGDFQDWLAGYWPALCANKPKSSIGQFKRWCEDKTLDWYLRANITEAVLAAAYKNGDSELDEALDWLAAMAGDEDEDWDYRLSAGSHLLDFPRDRHRAFLEDLAAQQQGIGTWFTRGEVDKAYQERKDRTLWDRFKDPWDFYKPTAIAERQRRWREEDRMAFEPDDSDTSYVPDNPFQPGLQQPYVRDMPKVGRNDPCPCGSGKKYKKCCLH